MRPGCGPTSIGAVAAAVPITSDTDATGRRVVSIGELLSAPCGGTHVRTLA